MSAAGCIKNMQERGILAQIFATGATKVRHYQVWQLSQRSLGARYQFLDFSSFLRRRLVSTEEADF